MNKRPILSPSFIHLFGQVSRFGIVGLTAALIHFLVVVLLVHFVALNPLIANLAGFVAAFQVSYNGHRLWTFRAGHVSHQAALPKLLIVQILNFIANESLFYIFLSLHLPYQAALLLVLTILPVFTFLAGRQWVFK